MSTNYYFPYKSNMESNATPYIKYLISNMVIINDWIEKFGIGDDIEIIKSSEKIASEISDIMNRMQEIGIEIGEIHNESFNVNKHIRDFKIKRILDNEGN
jgi:predicted  nucleic acid-binding Zn-ribbon protein